MNSILAIIFISLAVVSCILLLYSLYQLCRNEKVYQIQMKWLDNDEFDRLNKHSYDYMMDANKKNWFGLKYPNEKDYE